MDEELVALNSAAMAQMPPADLGASALKMLLTFLVLIGLLLATYWILKRIVQHRMQQKGASASIQIVEKRMLSPKTMLYLIEVEHKKILIAESQLEVKRLESLTVEECKDHSLRP